jgi:hypothetical protein
MQVSDGSNVIGTQANPLIVDCSVAAHVPLASLEVDEEDVEEEDAEGADA